MGEGDGEQANLSLSAPNPLRPQSRSSSELQFDAEALSLSLCAKSNTTSESVKLHRSYRKTTSSNSTPRLWGKEMESRLKAFSSGEEMPASVSGRTESVALMEDDEPKDWEAQVEPCVLVTFVSLPQGGNDLQRI